MSQRQNNGTHKVASCELFMQHVPASLQKNKPIRKRHLVPRHPSRNLTPQHAPSCEQRMKFFPSNMSPRVCRPSEGWETVLFGRRGLLTFGRFHCCNVNYSISLINFYLTTKCYPACTDAVHLVLLWLGGPIWVFYFMLL